MASAKILADSGCPRIIPRNRWSSQSMGQRPMASRDIATRRVCAPRRVRTRLERCRFGNVGVKPFLYSARRSLHRVPVSHLAARIRAATLTNARMPAQSAFDADRATLKLAIWPSLTQEVAIVFGALFTLAHQCIRSGRVYSRGLSRYIANQDEGAAMSAALKRMKRSDCLIRMPECAASATFALCCLGVNHVRLCTAWIAVTARRAWPD